MNSLGSDGLRTRVGRLGVFLGGLALASASDLRTGVADLEELGWGAVWCGEALGREAFAHAALILSATRRLAVGTGIANIWARDAAAMANGARTLAEAWPGRFVLGVGVSHRPVLAARGTDVDVQRPVCAMRTYLAQMSATEYRAPSPRVPAPIVLAALGPRMLDLAGAHADGALTYLVPVEHTRWARVRLGPRPLLAVEQAVVLAGVLAEARVIGDLHLRTYLSLPAYRQNLLRLGFSAAELEGAGSDRLFDALVAWGDHRQVMNRVRGQLAAGADHVAVHVLTATPVPETRILAELSVAAGLSPRAPRLASGEPSLPSAAG
ncbi:MAG TPA: LLM class F420-dependent oxidoreductase [Arthrobacter bacterium]|jgi:probable F420-dependent oxidoreductase|nr:LLM class F420-dependent oxidoreductase [Arthrobacter sp.]